MRNARYSHILMKREFSRHFQKNPQIQNFTQISPVQPSCSMRAD
jgi:hypothetical protein